MIRCLLITCFGLLAVDTATAAEIVRLDVEPAAIRLDGQRSRVQLVVTATSDDNLTWDVTRDVALETPGLISIDKGTVSPVQDGDGVLRLTLDGVEKELPVRVRNSDLRRPISFHWETLAILTRQGCNGGSCHGKPNGRGSLELSLNAFDPALDERSLIRGSFVRFTETLAPDESLLLKKPTLRIPHGGGKRLRRDNPAYDILKSWIAEGCRPSSEDDPHCVSVKVFPNDRRVIRLPSTDADSPSADSSDSEAGHSGAQQIRVEATFSDGSVRDVTRIATVSVSNDDIASVDGRGLVQGSQRGQTAVVVRYLDDIVSVYYTFVQDVPGFEWTDSPADNMVDQLVNAKLKQLQYLPSEVCDDSTFIRRASLDVRGLLPTVEETRGFLSSKRPDKRAELIDKFLDSPEYARFWGLRMSDLLRINREAMSSDSADEFSEWVYQSVASNQPYDEFVRQLLTVSGSSHDSPEANFFRVTPDTKTVTETVAQLFMGSRVMCAQCHNHPYESWTQDNYYQIGAAFHGVVRTYEDTKKKEQNGELVLTLNDAAQWSNPRTSAVQQPWPTDVRRNTGDDARLAFSKWLTSRENPFFARVAVNRMWAHLMGRGLVEPIDDFRSSNPASNVELLDALAADFAKAGFDRKHTLKLILNSHAYQRSSKTNQFNSEDEVLFSHARVRMLSAEQMQDAITRLSRGALDYEQLRAEVEQLSRLLEEDASNKPDAPGELDKLQQDYDKKHQRLQSYYMTQQPYPSLTSFLKAFGQPERKTACACERRQDANLDQALQLMNSPLMRSVVADGSRRLSKLTDDELVHELYIAAVSRPPQKRELETIRQHISQSEDRMAAIEDIVWAVINTNEFMFQH